MPVQFPSSYCSRNAFAMSGQTGLSGAVASLFLYGPTIKSTIASNGSLAAKVATTLFTNGLQALVKWQVLDDDGVTFRDALQAGNLANVAVNTGAGTSGGTAVTVFVAAPESVTSSNRACRAVIYAAGSGPGAGLGFDQASIGYDYRAPVAGPSVV